MNGEGDAIDRRARRRRPRVALVSWHTSPLAAPGAGDAGGMNLYVGELARALGASGLDVDVLTSSRAVRAPAAIALDEHARVLTFPDHRALRTARRWLPRYDVVHSHYWRSAAPAALLLEGGAARHVHSFHTLGHVKNATLARRDVPEPGARLRAERRLLATSDAVVVATEQERAQVAGLVADVAPPVHVVAPGVDTTAFRPGDGRAMRARLRVHAGPIVVQLGRVQPLKGVTLGARAVARLAAELPRGATFIVAGGPSGPCGAGVVTELRAMRRPGLDVRLLGRWRHAEVPALLSAADAVVVGSRSESFCLAALEAQACGVPVVGTAVGELPRLLGDGESGVLAPRDDDAFAARLLEILTAPRLRRSMQRAAVASAARYSWSATAATMRDVYAV